MIFYNDDIDINVFLETKVKPSNELMKKYFMNEKIEEFYEDEVYNTFIESTKISRKNFNKFLKELTNTSFEITINSNEKQTYIYEKYTFNEGDDFISKNYVPEEYCGEDGKLHLIGILFHNKDEKIYLKDLK